MTEEEIAKIQCESCERHGAYDGCSICAIKPSYARDWLEMDKRPKPKPKPYMSTMDRIEANNEVVRVLDESFKHSFTNNPFDETSAPVPKKDPPPLFEELVTTLIELVHRKGSMQDAVEEFLRRYNVSRKDGSSG
jgi:hypothetical protein